MRRTPIILILALLLAGGARAALPMWIQFSDAELQRDKRRALAAINSPEVWRRFPKYPHQPHYTPVLREIDFCFYPPQVNTVTVVIPTTHIGPRHRALIYVKFDHIYVVSPLSPSASPTKSTVKGAQL